MRSLWILLSVVFNIFISASAAFGQAPTLFISQPQAGTPEVLGNSKVLICNATGSPSPSYRWLKDGRTYHATARSGIEAGALRLRHIQRTDAGRYQCIATNSHGAILSSPTQLHVAYIRPFSNGGNANKFVGLGRAVVIDLPPIDCYPAPSVEWYDGGGGTRVSRESAVYHVTLRNQLVILDARSNIDSKMFKATATNVISQQTTDSQLFIVKIENVGSSVGDVIPEIVVPPVDTVVVSASDDDVARFECVVNARPHSHLTIRWSHRVHSLSGQSLTTTDSQWDLITADELKYQLSPFNRVLTILRPNPSDAGLYRCEASLRRPTTMMMNGAQTVTGTTASATSAAVTAAEARLTVHVKPSFVVSAARELEAEVETTVSLPCEASGSPKPSITWYYNGELISPTRYSSTGNNNHTATSSISSAPLVINHASVSQSGVYQCFATSEAGENNSVTLLTITSFVPEMIVVPQNQTVVSGDTITLPCAASGAPKPTISWSKVSAAMATRESVGSVRQSPNDLILTDVSITDTGIYTCTATNSRGTMHANANIQVAIRTRIVTPPHDTTVRRGSDVMLTCGVVSDALFPVSWHWSFNGVMLDMTDVRHRQRMPDGSLHIRSADGSDIGVYVCQVMSVGGNDSANARLNVVELPHPPTMMSARLSDNSETSVDLRWSAPAFNGNSDIRKFIIYSKMLNPDGNDSRSVGSEIVVGEDWKAIGFIGGKDSTEYTVHQLRPSQSYQFRVSATNEVGEGRPSVSTAPLTIPMQAPSSPPRGVVGSPRSNSSIILHWQPPEMLHWNGPLLGYQISHKPAGYPDSTLKFDNVTDPSKLFTEIIHLEPFHEYDIAISAYNSKGVGVFSAYTRVRTQEGRPVAPPTDVEAVPLNSTSLRVSWTAPHQRYINGINQGYKVIVMMSDGDATTEVIHVVMSNTSNMIGRQNGHVTGLRKFAKYSISVLCFTSKGDGPRSRAIATQTLEDVPDQVGSLMVSSKIDTHIDVSWTPPHSPNGLITGYVVRCRLADQIDWMASVDLPSTANNYTVEGLVARTAYHVDVAATTQVGVGESYLVAVETGVAPEKPESPLSVVVISIDSTSVQLQVTPSVSDHTSLNHWIIEAEHRQFHTNIPQWKEFSTSPGTTSTLVLVSGLQPDTEYRVRVSAENVAGRSAASEPSDWFRTASTAPSFPPEKMIVRPLNATTIVATWTPLPESQWNGPGGRRYSIEYWPCSYLEKEEGRLKVNTENDDVVSLTIGGLEEWTMYCVQLTACNERGCAENGVTTATVRTLESVPSGGPVNVSVVTLNSTAIHVSWSDVPDVHSNGRILGYKVFYRSTVDVSDSVETVETSKSQEKSVLLKALEKFTWYQIGVAAFTRSGVGPTSSPVVSTQTSEDVPAAPSGVYFPDVSESSVRIAWSPPSQPNGIVSGYRVSYGRKDRSSSSGSVLPVVVDESLGRERTDYLVKELDADAFYVFAVAARSRHGWGESAEVEVFTSSLRTVPDRPLRPSIVQSDIGSHWVVIGGLTSDPWQSGSGGGGRPAPIRNYTVQVQLNEGRFLTLAEHIAHNATEYNITGLVPYSRYVLRLAASNDVGLSEFSESSDAIQTHPTHPQHPPTDVTVSQQSSTTVLVRWKPPNDDGLWNGDKVGYRVFYRQLPIGDDADKSDDNEDAYSTVTTVYPHSNVLLTDLMSKVIVEVKVAAVNHVGHGPTSDPVDLFLREAAPSLMPDDLKASSVSPTSIHLTWKRIETREEDVEGEAYMGYKVFFWVSGRRLDMTRVKSLSLSDNQTLVSDLRMYTDYAFVVAAFGSGGSGPNSSVPVVARTLDGLPGCPEQLTIIMTSQSSVNLTWKPPSEPNGVIEGYELTYFQEALVDGESKSVHVLLSGDKTTYHARDLMPETSYTFRLSAKTRHGAGVESAQTITIGPQPGSPNAPDRPESTESDLGLVVTWNAPLETGSSPLLSYILQYRQYDDDPMLSDWMSVTVPAGQSLGSLGSKVTISSQQLIPGATYQFRLFAVNSQGISASSPMSEHFYSAEVASQAEPTVEVPFYKQWWFLLAMAVTGLVIVLTVVASLCITGRRRAKSIHKDKPKLKKKKRNGDAKTVQLPVMSIDDETGFATIERRHPPSSWGGQKYPKASTLPLYTRAPPRPSPGSIMYDTDLISQHEDSGNVSDKASQNGDSDGDGENHLAAFLHNASKRPQSFCATPLDDNPYPPPYTVSLNGGHSVMPKYQTMRPPKLSSFV